MQSVTKGYLAEHNRTVVNGPAADNRGGSS